MSIEKNSYSIGSKAKEIKYSSSEHFSTEQQGGPNILKTEVVKGDS